MSRPLPNVLQLVITVPRIRALHTLLPPYILQPYEKMAGRDWLILNPPIIFEERAWFFLLPSYFLTVLPTHSSKLDNCDSSNICSRSIFVYHTLTRKLIVTRAKNILMIKSAPKKRELKKLRDTYNLIVFYVRPVVALFSLSYIQLRRIQLVLTSTIIIHIPYLIYIRFCTRNYVVL